MNALPPNLVESSALEEREHAATEQEASLTLSFILQVLRSSKRKIFTFALAGLVLAAAVAILLPNVYTATASFVPPGSENMSSAAAVVGQLASISGVGGMLGGKGQGDLYVGILKSQAISRDLVRRFDLLRYFKVKKESDAEKKLRTESTFETGTKDPIVTISVTDKSPERARDLAQGYLQYLQQVSASLALTESSQRRQFYEQRLAKEKDALADAEVALKQNEERTGLVAPAGQMASNIQALAQIQAQITQRQASLAAMLHDETEENPDVLRIHNEIGSLQADANRLENGQIKGRFGTLSTAQVPELELEYIRKARDVKYHETLFEIISKQYEAARLDEARDAPLQVLDQPTVPDSKSGPHRSLIMALGLLIGLLGGAAWVLLQSVKD